MQAPQNYTNKIYLLAYPKTESEVTTLPPVGGLQSGKRPSFRASIFINAEQAILHIFEASLKAQL